MDLGLHLMNPSGKTAEGWVTSDRELIC